MGLHLLCHPHSKTFVPSATNSSSQGCEKGLEVWKTLPKTTAKAIGVAAAVKGWEQYQRWEKDEGEALPLPGF